MPHRAFGIYVHITWHTRFRQSLIRSADVDAVRAAIDEAAFRWQVHVHEVAILSDHVHVIASFRPEGGVLTFIRHAKSESSRRINLVREDRDLVRSEEHTSELQSHSDLVCRLLLVKK